MQQGSLLAGKNAPLAERLRPKNFAEYVGQEHILGKGCALSSAIANQKAFSCLLWGAPGTGKTTLALLLAQSVSAAFIRLSAVFSGVAEVRKAIDEAKKNQQLGRATVLFIDEIHRFNKAQQDAFLPYIEDGTIIFIAATTENPGFSVNKALLSRLQVFHLEKLSEQALVHTLKRGCQLLSCTEDEATLSTIARYADGDARKALNTLEAWAMLISQGMDEQSALKEVLLEKAVALDKNGDSFYELLSAFHKSLRGSHPDAAMYWFARLIEAGVDPLIMARRMMCVASEDVGNADPQALTIALNAHMSYERLGAPEGFLVLAQCVSYLAMAPKSNASYLALKAARAFVKANPEYEVPIHLRNAPTDFHQAQGYCTMYRYPHDEPYAFAAGQRYLPEAMGNWQCYQPNERGYEKKFAEKLARLRQLNQQSSE